MVSNKLLVSTFATLASLVVVNAGPCKPKTYATDTTSATSASASSVPASLSSETSTAPFVIIETSTATADGETTTTATENGTTMTVSVSAASTTTADSETSTEVSESDTTGVANSETTAVTSSADTSSAEATTVVSSTEITTVATSFQGSSTVAETTATTTTAEAGPTALLINGNFDLGRTSPWLTTANPPVRLGSNDPSEGQAYGELEYSLVDGQAYNNYVYQAIDKSRLKAGSYELSAFLRVDSSSNNIYDDGCNSMAVGCAYGDPNMLNYVSNSFVTVSSYGAVNEWYPLTTICSLDEQALSNNDYVSVVIGFSCANAVADVDAVVFEEVL